jgi:hypothetical protein
LELANILKELWRRRVWVALGLLVAVVVSASTIYRIGLNPPSLEKKALEFAAADTQLLIDSRRSSLTDLGQDLGPLVTRADVFSRLMTSAPVKRSIAAEVGLPPEGFTAQSQADINRPRAEKESTAEQRANQIRGEGVGYRLFFDVEGNLPVISIASQAPTTKDALRLADGAAVGVAKYIERLKKAQPGPVAAQVQVRRLGKAQGGLVNQGADTTAAALGFGGTFVGACLLILLGSNVVSAWRSKPERRGGRGRGHPGARSCARGDPARQCGVGGRPAEGAVARRGAARGRRHGRRLTGDATRGRRRGSRQHVGVAVTALLAAPARGRLL